jgi:hypothetical protein
MQPVQRRLFAEGPVEIFLRVHRTCFPHRPLPSIRVLIRPYASANASVRLQGGTLEVRLADLLETAPDEILHALAHILFSKLYRRRPPRDALQLYREWLYTGHTRTEMHQMRRARGRKYISGPLGLTYDLDPLFDELNARYFANSLPRPALGWSRRPSRTLLGHFDPVHNAIILSSILDRPSVDPLAVRYILFHEMLHIQHPAQHRNGRRCVHTREFREAEQQFERIQEAKAMLKSL